MKIESRTKICHMTALTRDETLTLGSHHKHEILPVRAVYCCVNEKCCKYACICHCNIACGALLISLGVGADALLDLFFFLNCGHFFIPGISFELLS